MGKFQKNHFPLFADIREKKAVIIGGGPIAARRVAALTDFAFEIEVIAPSFVEKIRQLAAQGLVVIRERAFEETDLDGAFLVVAATDKRSLNREIGLLAKGAGAFVSVADAKEECNFYFPGLAHTSELTAGIVGTGTNHILVKKSAEAIRETLNSSALKGTVK